MREKPGFVPKSTTAMEQCAEGFRINTHLLGIIIAIKKTGDVEHHVHNTENVKLLSTVKRPIDFESNLFRWLCYVKAESKRIKNENLLKEKADKENQEQLMIKKRKIAEEEKRKFINDFFKPITSWNLKKEESCQLVS